jgi:hypothetical protein
MGIGLPLCAQSQGTISFTSSDKLLNESFAWAKSVALNYAHDCSDPVGYWYEAALPNREAFCMRDISHQCIGGEILGLSKHNYNMMYRFAENISESKDWCSYWEINRYNKPAPVDYSNDKQFWYTLTSSFDVIQACLKLYNWTGNIQYLYNPVFENFYNKTLNEYVKRWKLEPQDLLIRPTYLNTELPLNENDRFKACKGIPSYVETEGDFSLAGDLVASLYAGFKAYGEILYFKSEKEKSNVYFSKAEQYKSFLNDIFWNRKTNHFDFFWSCVKGDFLETESQGETYIVWFNAASTPERSQITINRILKMNCNVENKSHYPTLLYRYHMPEEAYKYLVSLKNEKRNTYPEVSYGLIEGLVEGMMGIHPQAFENVIETLPQFTSQTQWAEVKGLPIFDTNVEVKHEGKYKTSFTNRGSKKVVWRASFYGEHKVFYLNNKMVAPKFKVDIQGNIYSYIDVNVISNQTIIVHI